MKTWLAKSAESNLQGVHRELIGKSVFRFLLDTGIKNKQLGPEHNPDRYASDREFIQAIQDIRPNWGSKILTMSRFSPGDRIILTHRNRVIASGRVAARPRYMETKTLSRTGKPIWGHVTKMDWDVESVKRLENKRLRFKGSEKQYKQGTFYDVSNDSQLLKYLGLSKLPADQPQLVDGPEVMSESKGTAREGQVNEHRRMERERDPSIVKEAKDAARKKGGGSIQCLGCDVKNKEIFKDFEVIDAHHKKPLAQADDGGVETSIEDLVMLCPTCHRAVHRILSIGKADGPEAIQYLRALRGLGRAKL